MANDKENNSSGLMDVGGWDLGKVGGSYRSVSTSHGGDLHVFAGQSDKGGDAALSSATLRLGENMRNAVVVQVDAALTTTPTTGHIEGRSTSGYQRDTGVAKLTVGNEFPVTESLGAGVYAYGGYANGGVLDVLRDVKNAQHSLLGMGKGRESEASSDGRLVGGVAARADYQVFDASISENFSAQFMASAAAQVGTDRSHVAGAAYFRVGEKSPYAFHADLPGTPAQDNFGSGVYAGVVLTKPFNDIATNAQGLASGPQLTFQVGADVQVTDNFTLGVSATEIKGDHVRNQDIAETGKYAVHATFRF